MTFPVRTLLACWVVAATTGMVVRHRHEAAPGHTHGLGWASLPTPQTPSGTAQAHAHLVLLGVEFGAAPTEEGASGESAGGPKVGPIPDVEVAPEVRIDIDPATPTADHVAGIVALLKPVEVITGRDSFVCHISPTASRSRSGVLRS